ncbi:MAG: hypothetical protein FJ290_13975, partial [Planctomycetes bacterium]|nr:hypothetical protein [Planctomycetota bacterium]
NLTELITIDLHVKTYGSTGTWQGIIAKRDDGNHQEKVQYQLCLSDDLQLYHCICVGGPDNWWFPPTGIRLAPNQWHHLVATYDAFAREVTIRVDGDLRKRFTSVPVIRPSNNPVWLGWSGWHNEFFNGELRDVRVVNTLAEKVAELRRKGADRCALVGITYFPHRFRSGQGGLSGVLEVRLLNPRDAKGRATLQVRIGDKTLQETAEVPPAAFGRIRCTVPESPADAQAQLEVTEEGKVVGKDTATIPGTKDIVGYRGYVVSHTHSDLCWPDTPEACMNANVAAIAKSVELAEKVPNYRFTMEHVLFLREYLRRNPDRKELVRKLMAAGVIEVGAFYTGPWELTSGGEGLVRQLYAGKLWVKKNLGVDASTVWNVDVAGHTAQLPQILAKAGVRGLVISAGATDNTFDAPYLLHETRGPFLFRWQAPDGSAVPTWTTPWGYGSGGALGLRNDSLDELSLSFQGFLDDVRRNHAAHALPRIAFVTDGTDIQLPSARAGENIARWNAAGHFPPLVYASTAELFRAVEREPLPAYAGEMPSPWDTVQAQGVDCFLLDRRLEGRLLAAEKLAAFASLAVPDFAYPQEALAGIWEDRLFALEHNWGGKHGQVSNGVKTAKVRDANARNDEILRATFRALARAIRFQRPGAVPILVFNPLSWDRRDVVTCALPVPKEKAGQLTIRDYAGRLVPHQLSRSAAAPVVFCAEVPSLGYATYYASWDASEKALPSPFRVDAATSRFENDFYRVELDPKTGGAASLHDKRSRQELVRRHGGLAWGELVALEDDDMDIRCHLTGKRWAAHDYTSKISVAENGPVRLVVEVAGPFMDASTRRHEIILYRELPRIDLVTSLGWEGRRNVQLLQAFPLNVANPVVKYAVPYAAVEYGKETKFAAPWPFGPVAGYPWRGVRGWVELANDAQAVTLASECNYAAFRDLTAPSDAGYLIQPLLLRTVRSCGDAQLFYTQKGTHQFRFALESKADSPRLGEEHNCPLLSHVVAEPSAPSPSLPDRLCFAQVRPDNVGVAVVKRAEDGQGIILRLVETGSTGGSARAEILLFKPVRTAFSTSIVEENGKEVPIHDGRFSIPVTHSAIETVRVIF